MEKRILLAAVLSFFLLYVWAIIHPQPKNSDKISQYINNKQVNNTLINKNTSEPLPLPAEALDNLEKAEKKLTKIENDHLIIETNNVGGVIDNIYIKNYSQSVPLFNLLSINLYNNFEFKLVESDINKIIYRLEQADFIIEKVYTLKDNDNIVQSDIKITNITNDKIKFDEAFDVYHIKMSNLKNNDPNFARDKSLLEYVVYSVNGIYRKANAFKFSEKESKIEDGKVNWVGYRDRYFCTIIKPLFDTEGYQIKFLDEHNLSINIFNYKNEIQPKETITFSSLIYSGPEISDKLKEYDMGFEKIKLYYRFGLFDLMAKLVYFMMHFMFKIFPNWGVCIILTSVIIYFSTYPLTLRSMTSMKKMQQIQPEMNVLREKHKNNPQKLQQETFALYKKYKINPMGGCLPLLLQMPIFIGLYQSLWRDVSFKGAGFLWIKDLTGPDRLFLLPFNLPFMGNEINLLPLLMVIIMMFQQKLTTQNMIIADPQQQAQQKMMSTIMPFLMGFIFYKFASGLTLYFTLFYVFSTFTQWKLAKGQKVQNA